MVIGLAEYRDFFATLPKPEVRAGDGAIVNFMGVETESAFLRHLPTNGPWRDNPCYGPGVPEVGWGETFFEWISIVDAIAEARDRFVMAELGGGYALRTVNVEATLRAWRPLPAFYTVVEAEETTFGYARRHMANNGIDPDGHWLLNVALGDGNVPDLFPLDAGNYGNNVLFGGNRDRVFQLLKSADVVEPVLRRLINTSRLGLRIDRDEAAGMDGYDIGFVSTLTLADVLAPLPRLDLLDMDIQSAEARVVPPAMASMNAKVRRAHIGTHGREVHDLLASVFRHHDWDILFDFEPNQRFETDLGPFETDDGILVAANPRLRP